MIKVLYNFMVGSFSLKVNTLLTMMASGIVTVKMFVMCHVISKDHMFQGWLTLWVKALHIILQRVKARGLVVVEI